MGREGNKGRGRGMAEKGKRGIEEEGWGRRKGEYKKRTMGG